MSEITQAKRIVVKVGTSTLTYDNGKANFRTMEELCKVLSDLQNSGKEMILVTSGALAIGMSKLGLKERPREIEKKQAVAAVGQCELMFLYDKFFGEFNHTVAQVLLSSDVMIEQISKRNVQNTFRTLLDMGIIPVVNENDTVSIDELMGAHIGDNDTLSATVAVLAEADLLVLLTDIDGLYDADPRKDPNAKRVPRVEKITDEIKELAAGKALREEPGECAPKFLRLWFLPRQGFRAASSTALPRRICTVCWREKTWGRYSKRNKNTSRAYAPCLSGIGLPGLLAGARAKAAPAGVLPAAARFLYPWFSRGRIFLNTQI